MRRISRNLFRAALAGVFLLAGGTGSTAPPKFAGPGPTTISPEEAAIQANPAKGLREAVVLDHEIEVRDYLGKASADMGRDVRVHRRIKVLSEEFSPFVEVYFDRDTEGVVDWWGRAIHPDGTVHELRRSAMRVVHDPLVYSSLEGRFESLVPGTILDFGWTLRQREYLSGSYGMPVALEWPTRDYHLRWLPARGGRTSILRRGLAPFPVEVAVTGPDLDATGRDIPATEPLAQPEAEAYLWLLYGGRSPAEHWAEVAKREDAFNNFFLNRDGEIRKAIERLNLPADAPLDQKLRAAYAFIEDRIQLAWFEEKQPVLRNDPGWTSGAALRGNRARARDVSRLMVGFARRLGAVATTLLVWDTGWDSESPVYMNPDAHLVAVRPQDAPGAAWIALAPGWGLPYGVLPYPFAGTRGLLAASDKISVVDLPLPTGTSTSRVEGTVTPSKDRKAVKMEWTWTGTGQEGLFNRRRLQTVKEELRAAALARQCARLVASRDLIRVQDILDRNTTEGTAPDLFDRSKPFALHCTTNVPLPESAAGAPLRFPFPYRALDADLRLDPPNRRSLYQLQFPVEHVAVIEVRAPEGLVPGQPPADIRVEAPCCGSYARTVTRTDTGYRVERKLTLPNLRIAAAEASNFGEFMEKVRVGDETALEFGEGGDNRTN